MAPFVVEAKRLHVKLAPSKSSLVAAVRSGRLWTFAAGKEVGARGEVDAGGHALVGTPELLSVSASRSEHFKRAWRAAFADAPFSSRSAAEQSRRQEEECFHECHQRAEERADDPKRNREQPEHRPKHEKQ
jgi:hypothetical protein